MKKGVSLSVFGRVQGVGFRYTVMMLADKLDIRGTVENKSDGSVYIEAIGREKQLQEFIDTIKASPSRWSKVEQVIEKPLDPLPKFKKFDVVG